MTRTEPVAAAHGLAQHLFPDALTVLVGGSVLTERRTRTSDLDMVVVTGPLENPHRHSLSWEGWPVEVLVHDEETLAAYCADNLARRWPGIPRLIAEGTLVSDRTGLGHRLQTEMRRRLADGPTAATVAELEAHRYELTDLLDDLAGADDPAELAFIASRVLNKTALLALLAGRHWQGSGKWLLRELRDHDPVLADRLAHSLTAPPRLAGVAREVLDGAGGPLRDGYRVTDPRRP
ncbi:MULTISPECIES: nucleotidyltransferase domain-containing protein [Streptomyces]|uniref:nucleotidyltransferase domain-containing protein n=1 Tax=Streptomyces TaxID=1883 RepID=UPI001F195996|nr:nucleotidyltransferase domain-containing protein [Streptomyces noursei]MCE4941554.1 nucleotidyltransferase domain-containing protein [Streptomyces noursei]